MFFKEAPEFEIFLVLRRTIGLLLKPIASSIALTREPPRLRREILGKKKSRRGILIWK
jgi:hypothetical protein